MQIKTNFKEEDVIRYIYGDVSPEEKGQIARALLEDDDLGETFKGFGALARKIDRALWEPSAGAAAKIMEFSKNFGKGLAVG